MLPDRNKMGEYKATKGANKESLAKMEKNQKILIKTLTQGFSLLTKSMIKISNDVNNKNNADNEEKMKYLEAKIDSQAATIAHLKEDIEDLKTVKSTNIPLQNNLTEVENTKKEKNEENQKKNAIHISVPVMNPNNVFINESMSFAKVVTRNERRKPSFKFTEIQEKEIIENVTKRNLERIKKRAPESPSLNEREQKIISLEEKNL